MKISKQEIERRMSRFNEVCRNSGVKLTHQRMEIFREVAQTGDHPEAESVYKGVRERMPTISLDTVYRTLWLLRDLGLINTLGPPRERTRFDANLSHHHHFVCIRCGLTRDFYSDELDELKLPESVKNFGYVETMQVEVKGVCRKCAVGGKSQFDNFNKKEV
jgi:Fur family peroxide stress response transcriptional regulator